MLQNCRRREIFCISRYQSFSRRSYISHSQGRRRLHIRHVRRSLWQGCTLFAKKLLKLSKKQFPVKRVGVAVMGLEVPHTHIHLIPINKETDMYFSKEKLKVSSEKIGKNSSFYRFKNKIVRLNGNLHSNHAIIQKSITNIYKKLTQLKKPVSSHNKPAFLLSNIANPQFFYKFTSSLSKVIY